MIHATDQAFVTSVAAFNDNVKERTVYMLLIKLFFTSIAAFNDNVKQRTVYMLLIKLFFTSVAAIF